MRQLQLTHLNTEVGKHLAKTLLLGLHSALPATDASNELGAEILSGSQGVRRRNTEAVQLAISPEGSRALPLPWLGETRARPCASTHPGRCARERPSRASQASRAEPASREQDWRRSSGLRLREVNVSRCHVGAPGPTHPAPRCAGRRGTGRRLHADVRCTRTRLEDCARVL